MKSIVAVEFPRVFQPSFVRAKRAGVKASFTQSVSSTETDKNGLYGHTIRLFNAPVVKYQSLQNTNVVSQIADRSTTTVIRICNLIHVDSSIYFIKFMKFKNTIIIEIRTIMIGFLVLSYCYIYIFK